MIYTFLTYHMSRGILGCTVLNCQLTSGVHPPCPNVLCYQGRHKLRPLLPEFTYHTCGHFGWVLQGVPNIRPLCPHFGSFVPCSSRRVGRGLCFTLFPYICMSVCMMFQQHYLHFLFGYCLETYMDYLCMYMDPWRSVFSLIQIPRWPPDGHLPKGVKFHSPFGCLTWNLQGFPSLNKDLQVWIWIWSNIQCGSQAVILYFLLCEILFACSISISIWLFDSKGFRDYSFLNNTLKPKVY